MTTIGGQFGGQVDDAQDDGHHHHPPGDEGDGGGPVARLEVGQQVPDREDDDAVADHPRQDAAADGARAVGGQALGVERGVGGGLRCVGGVCRGRARPGRSRAHQTSSERQ